MQMDIGPLTTIGEIKHLIHAKFNGMGGECITTRWEKLAIPHHLSRTRFIMGQGQTPDF